VPASNDVLVGAPFAFAATIFTVDDSAVAFLTQIVTVVTLKVPPLEDDGVVKAKPNALPA
jgi:hypothetical protein